MLHREFEPPEGLRDTIKCFWYNRRAFDASAPDFEVVPDGYAEIIFHFGNGCDIALGTDWKPLPSPFMMGLLNQPAHFRAHGRLEIIGVRCFPWTVFDLLGLPSGKGVQVFEHPVARLQDKLQALVSADKLTEALSEVRQYFEMQRSHIAVDSMLFKAGLAMQEAGGTLPVSGVAAAAHATIRTLERRFRQSSGHTVKDVSGLMRFELVRNRLWHDPKVNLAGLSLELGYTDQSHLSREFKRYSGTTPAAFARKARERQQAMSRDFVAFVQD